MNREGRACLRQAALVGSYGECSLLKTQSHSSWLQDGGQCPRCVLGSLVSLLLPSQVGVAAASAQTQPKGKVQPSVKIPRWHLGPVTRKAGAPPRQATWVRNCGKCCLFTSQSQQQPAAGQWGPSQGCVWCLGSSTPQSCAVVTGMPAVSWYLGSQNGAWLKLLYITALHYFITAAVMK